MKLSHPLSVRVCCVCVYIQPAAASAGALVPSGGSAVATRSNSGPVSGAGNVGIRRAEIKQGI